MLIEKRMEKELKARKSAGTFRVLKALDSGAIDFASNDYLGFARSKSLYAQIKEQWKNSIGSTGSRLLTGHSGYAEDLETRITLFHKAEAGLIFNTGFMANWGLIGTLIKPGDSVIYDLHIHASMQEGIKRSRAQPFPFFHQNLDHLEKRLKQAARPAFVCIESLYSIDGQLAPLKEICELCDRYNALLIVDEAHATGVIGRQGEGLVASLGLEEKVYARIHTFGKGLGVFGATVLGSHILKQYLINFCPSLIYTTSLPHNNLVAIQCAYDKMKEAHSERHHLRTLIAYFIERAKKIGIHPPSSESPILPVLMKGPEAKALSEIMQKSGIDVRPIVIPTVPLKNECLRICLHAFNTFDQIDELFRYLR